MQWTQLEPGTLVAERLHIDLGTVVVQRRRYETAFKGDGELHGGSTLFGFTSGESSVTRWTGLDVTGEDIATTRGRVDVFASAPETLYAVIVDGDEAGALEHIPANPELVRSAHTRHLRAYVRGIFERGFRPGRFARRDIAANVLWLLTAAVGNEAETMEPTRPQGRRIAAVRRCLEYIDQRLGETVMLPDLSAISGLRPRSLINAFEAVTGTSPMAYLRASRLSRVRRVLENAGGKMRIIDVAADWGFWHMGHFTAAYRAMFGETPSQTLARSTKMPCVGAMLATAATVASQVADFSQVLN